MKPRTALVGLPCMLLALGGPAAVVTADSTSPHVEVVPWSDSVLPPSFSPDDDPRSLRGLPPDSLDEASRPRLPVAYAETEPAIDGDLTDWPIVRWYDLRGARTLVRGIWTGTADAALDFALLWTPKGLVLGARLVDDSLDVEVGSTAAEQRVESVLLYVGSSSPVVQRYWRSAERAFRVWADGRLEAWTRLQNRRPVLFDPTLLGVHGAARATRQAAPAGAVAFELFVPWDAIFPALPHDEAALLLNVLVEDVDAGKDKLFAWATRPAPAATGSATLAHTWARMVPEGAPATDTWIVSLGTHHLEAGIPCEWSLLHLGGEMPEPMDLAVGEHGKRPLRCAVPSTPALLRYETDFSSSLPWPRDRRLELDLGPWRQEPWRHDVLHRIPTAASFAAGAREVAETPPSARVFPRPADVDVRLEEIAGVAAALGEWRTVRYTDRGILATRAAAWASIEHRLLECQMLRDLMLGPPDDATSKRLLDLRWPERTATGIPVGTLLIRGERSDIDGSMQPYALYVSRAASLGQPMPLVVVLHDFGENAMSPFESTGLAEAVEEHGWIALSPFGRGNAGFALAGERDVLDDLAQVRQDLPVDGKRIYVLGAGMGGTGAWLLSLRHGSLFAAAGVVSAYADMDQPGIFQLLGYRLEELFFYETMNPARLLRPGLETAFRVVHAERDPRISVVHARVMAEKLQEYGLKHEVLMPATQEGARDLFVAQIRKNLDFFADHPRSSNGVSEPAWFRGSGGPVATVFPRGPFAVVTGTHRLPTAPVQVGSDSTGWHNVTGPEADAMAARELTLEWRSLFAGEPPTLDDTRLDASFLESTNLVLLGDPRTHALLQKMASALPVHYDGDRFEVAGQSWNFSEAGILYATPNTDVPERTLVVLSGMAGRLGGFQKSLLKLGADYVVVNDAHEILAIGHFTEDGEATPPDPPR